MNTEPIALYERAGFGVVVLGASAGGQSAIIAVLRALPLDFDVPIVVVQHLAAESAVLGVYAARLPFSFEWIDEGSRLAARTVLVCPARACAELLPDGSFHLEPCEGAIDYQIDRLLRSVARSFSHRAIGVVLTGMGNDGAAGARELHDAGGRVLVQSEGSADYPEMPRAAVGAGAADLVVPLGDMAQVLTDLVAGAVRPKARSELEAIARVFGAKGEIAARAREIDWARTPLGPAMQWPVELRLVARTAMESPHPTAIWWGAQLVLIYNEAYRRFLGTSKHPGALGDSARKVWREVWDEIGPLAERAMKDGAAVHEEDSRFLIDRHGFVEEIFANFGYSPIRDARGAVAGLHVTCWEATEKAVAERRMAALRALAARITGAGTLRQACEQATAALACDPLDLPFALLYLIDADGRQASLASAVGLSPGSAAAPHTMSLTGAIDTWALQRLVESNAAADVPGVLLEDLDRRVPDLPSLVGGHVGRPVPRSVFVLPLRLAQDKLPAAALVAGLSPHRPFDEDYHSFVRMVAQQIGAGLVEARARQLERERHERLAELDRAKTEFFANISHEFRTPLTLLLSPLDELRRRRDELPGELAAEIDVAARNSRRLLRLVNSLLDFSQIERRRQQRATLQPTDLAGLTADIASVFRGAIERAGLALRVQCQEDLPLVPVDREMWETIVSNLLSNALKFTFEGEIVVRLQALSLHAELVVSDTGIGIPKHEVAHVFKRFHRVRGARARTIEGSGIGLALVHELVARLGGQLRVSSSEGRGTAFTIWIPLKPHRQSVEALAAVRAEAPAARIAAVLAEEAHTWVDDRATQAALDEVLGAPNAAHLRLAPDAHVLVADDNADLRSYLQRLLGAYWKVTAVADGAQALHEARRHRPDLILADVGMPNLDGFGLLRAVRADGALKHTPVVFLTARAGEDTAIEGLLAGADDYLAKPFSARELIARVGGQIALSRTRREAERRAQAILERMGDAHCVLDREFCIVSANAAAERLLGKPRAALVGRSHWEAFPASADAPVGHALRRIVAEGVEQHLIHHYLGEGYDLHLELDAYPTEEGGVAMFWRDITERVRAEAALRESEQRYRLLFEQMDEAYAVVEVLADAAGHWTDFRFLEVNPAFMRHTGMPHPMGRTATELLGTPNPRWAELYGRAAQTGESIRLEELEPNLGRVFDLNIFRLGDEGSRRVAVLFTDITERKRAEAALRASQARQAFLLTLSDALRPLADPIEIQSEAARVLGRHLGASRASYAEVEADDAHFVVERDYTDGVPSYAGRYLLDSFGPGFVRELRAGRTVSLADAERDERLSEAERALLAAGTISAFIGVPLVKGGRLVAVFSLHYPAPHAWPADEVALIEETAERTWSAVERARAQAALRESEQKYRTLFDAIDEGLAIVEMIYDERGEITDMIYRQVNAAYERQGGIREVVGRSVSQMLPSVEAVWLERYRQVAKTGQPLRVEDYQQDVGRWFDVYFSRIDQAGRFVAIVFNDISERKRAEAQLREREQRQAFLLQLTDILQRLSAPNDIKTAAMHRLGTHLGVSRAQYHEVDDSGEFYSADGIGYAEGLPLLDLKYRIGQFGSFVAADFEAGRPFRSDDLLTDPRPTAREREAYGFYQIRAGAGIPLLRGGKLVAILAVHDMRPHAWTDLEMELIRETAERVWVAVEKVRTERAVRESDERRAFLLRLSDRLRVEVDARAIAAASLDLLAEHMRLDRAYVAQVDKARDQAEIGPAYRRPDLARVEGSLTLSDFPEAFARVEAATLVLADTAADATLSERDKRGFAALRMGALIVASARKGTRNPVWALLVAMEKPRHWTAAEAALVEEVAERTWAGIERARAETALRTSDERNAFLVRFSDAVRGLSDPALIARQTCRILTEHLGTQRTLWAAVDWDTREYVAEWAFSADGAVVEPSRWPLDEREPFVAEHLAGRSVVYDDVALDARIPDPVKAAMTERGLLAGIAVPVVVAGRLLAVLNTSQRAAPRRWRAEEVAFVESLAQRAWVEIERARAERTLRESEQRLRTLADTAPALIWFNDPAGNNTFVNRVFVDYTGRSAHQIAAEGWHGLIEPEHEARYVAGFLQAVSERRPWHDRNRIRRADGVCRWFENYARPLFAEDGRYLGHVGISVDINDTVEAETALRESEARLRQFGEASSDVLWVRNAHTLQCEYLSPAFESIYGMRVADALAGDNLQIWTELIVEEDRAHALACIERVRSGERVRFEYRVRRPDGAVRWLRNTDFPMRGANGQVERIGGVGQDFTERKAIEAQLERANRAKTEFLAVLAHELRSPLAPLRNAVALLERQSEATAAPAQTAREIMRRQLEHLARLVGDLLEVSRIEHGKIELRIEPIVLGSALVAAIEAVQPLIAERGQRLTVRLPSATLRMAADAARLTQIVANLLTNASKFTPDGGAVELAVEDSDTEVAIIVRDSGRGISADALPHVFELFAQGDGQGLDRALGGLGIGLALVKQLVELHGGTVAAESAGLGQGATFIVRLPHGPTAGG